MEIKIGITQSTREIAIESDLDAQQLKDLVDSALTNRTPLVLEDGQRRVVVPADSIAYVDAGPSTQGRVGFGIS